MVEVFYTIAGDLQRVLIIFSVMVGNTGDLAVHISATQVLGTDHFTGRGFHQRRAGQKDGALVAHDDRFIRHGRNVGATGGTQAHYYRDLRNALGGHAGLIEEDATEVITIRKHVILTRQVGTTGVNQIDAGQVILFGDFLSAQVFFHRDRVIGAALYRGVVGDDHAFHTADATDTGNDTGGRYLFLIHVVTGQLRQLKEG